MAGHIAIVLYAVIVGVLVYATVDRARSNKRWRVSHRQAGPRRLQAGDRVRFVVPVPELGIEAGERGRVYMIYPGDDTEWWVVPDRNSAARVKFFEGELWMLERVELQKP